MIDTRASLDEWLETDGLGGYASGTVSGVRTRRYHALLLSATTPPTGRIVLVNGIEAWVEVDGRRVAITSQLYAPDVRHPDGADRIASFEAAPWPAWRFAVADGIEVVQEIFVPRGHTATVLSWSVRTSEARALRFPSVRLFVRPLLSGRDMHATHHENAAFRFDADARDGTVRWEPYHGIPAIVAASNGSYAHDPQWYRSILYGEERARGLDDTEDLASPGTFGFDLSARPAALVFAMRELPPAGLRDERFAVEDWAGRIRAVEQMRRGRLGSRLCAAADAYIVSGNRGRTIIAGYPWFSDWGRDTFIAVRGLCIATDRLAAARAILLAWAGEVSAGMLPNRFTEQGDAAEFNSVDAALWYVIALNDFLNAMAQRRRRLRVRERAALENAIRAILEGHAAGTRHGIRMDADGLLAAGEPGVQLTWMDAKVGDHVITPRIGKPVEIQALWINALAIGARLDETWREPLERARSAFATRFWNAEAGSLHDVVDVDHVRGAVDPTCRPNQVLAIGGLPVALLDTARAATVLDTVERRLLTPLGLRSLAPGEPGYAPRYEGGPAGRDSVYHQGTVWPWLIGAFVDAWLRVHGNGAEMRAEARRRFVEPLLAHLDHAGIGHVSEIADADPPHTPRGCPFQAWSVGELIRADQATRPADWNE
ncbi:MAG: amylo-alpha-1,6-glucosidase [Gemmatimonadetes bacterium]|nr:amylo-alpha-1,6-glucosidase [Gemmatimonadota bacterium]